MFNFKIDNSINIPFIPKVNHKNKNFCLTELNPEILKAQANPKEYFSGIENSSEFSFEHPFLTEIKQLPTPNLKALKEYLKKNVRKNLTMKNNFKFIDNKEAL